MEGNAKLLLYAFQTVHRFTEKLVLEIQDSIVKLKFELYELEVEKKRLNTLKFMFISKWEYPAFAYKPTIQ